MQGSFVYMLASKMNGTLYVVVTKNLSRRIFEHKTNAHEGFTQKYGVHTLVFYEQYDDLIYAIAREKQLKNWKRQWKIDLIEETNPQWNDLYDDLNK